MEMKLCQCCGMPMGETDEMYGIEKDGRKSADYCKYCYENGDFTFHGTMEEMIEICLPPMLENSPGMTEGQARDMMRSLLPTLKHWQSA